MVSHHVKDKQSDAFVNLYADGHIVYASSIGGSLTRFANINEFQIAGEQSKCRPALRLAAILKFNPKYSAVVRVNL